MSVLQESQIETSVYACNFQCFIRQANITMKFPCSYFVQWRTLNSKIIVQTNKHSPQDGSTIFDEKLTINVEMLYDHSKLQFVKRQTIVELYLISRSRPDQNKLVGRVTIDLAKVVNVGMYQEPTEFKLNFSSVGGVLIMQFKALDRRLTTLALQDLDKSSFLDFVAQTAFKGPARAQSMIQSHYQPPNGSQKMVREARAVSPVGNSSKSAIKKSIMFNKDSLIRMSSDIQQEVKQEEIIHNYRNIPVNSAIKDKIVPVQKQEILGQQLAEKEALKSSVAKQVLFNESVEHIQSLEPIVNHTIQQQNFIKTSSAPIFQKIASQNQQASNQIRKSANNNLLQKENEENSSLLIHQREQLSVCTKQNEELRAQLDKWRGRSNESQTSKNRLEEINIELNDKIIHEKNVNKQLQQQIQKKNKIIGDFDHQLTQKQSIITILEEKISSFTEKQKIISKSNDVMKKENAQLAQTIQQLKKNIELHQKNVVFYEQKCQRYETKIKKSTQIEKQLNNSIKLLRESEQKLKIKIQELQIQNNGLVDSIEHYRKKIQQKMQDQSINDERHHLQEEIQHYKAKLEDTVDKFQQLSKQLSYVTGKYMELENVYEDQMKISENLQSQITDLEVNKQNIVEENISQVIQVVQRGQQSLHQLKNQNDQLKKEIQVMKINKLEEKNKMQLENQAFTLEINSSKNEINILQGNINKLQETNDNLQKYNQSLQNQLVQKEQIIKENNFLKQQIDNLSLQIDQLNREIEQMGENQLQNHRVSGLQQLQQQNKELRQQYKGVEGQIQFYQKQLLVLKDEIVRIRQSRSTKQNDKQLQLTQEKINEYEDVIAKLNNNFEQQIYQNNELSETIMRYMDKEAKMKQTLEILEKESKEIFNLVQEKQQNEQSYRRAIEELQLQIVKLNGKEAEQKSPTKSQNSYSPPKYQQSPKLSTNDLKKLQREKDELQVINLQLKHLNEQLNSELMNLNFQFNQKKSILQSQISQLTEKVTSLQNSQQKQEEISCNKIKQSDKNYRAKDMEVQIWKSRAKHYEQQKSSVENEFNKLKTTLQEIQEEKFILQSSINEKQIKILEMQEEINLLLSQITQFQQLNPINNEGQPICPSKSNFFVQLKQKLFSKTLQNDWESLIQSVLQRSMTAQQTSKLLNLQQKSRLLSKQLQKIKSQLLKSEWRNNQQKITLMGLFKKCDSTVSQLISAAQSLNQNQSSFL